MADQTNRSLEPVDPFSSLMALRSTMNRLFEESVLGLIPFDSLTRTYPLDMRETESEYILEVALPGVKPEDVTITATDDTLTISAVRGTPSEGAADQKPAENGKKPTDVYVRRERYTGEMSRSITFPTLIVPEKITASYAHGVVTIHTPKVARVEPKRIPVRVEALEEVRH